LTFVGVSDVGDSLDVRTSEIVGSADDGFVRISSVIVEKLVEISRFDVSEIAWIIKLGSDVAVDKSVAVSNEREFTERFESVLSLTKAWREFVESVDWVSVGVELSAEMEEVELAVMGDNEDVVEEVREETGDIIDDTESELEDAIKKDCDPANELESAEENDSTNNVKEFTDEAIVELIMVEELVKDLDDALDEDKEVIADGCDEIAGNDWVDTEVSVKVCESLDVVSTEEGSRVEVDISVLILNDVNV